MEIIASQNYLLMSPKKIRMVVDIIRRLTPNQAIERLPFVGKRAALPLIKVIKSAVANARVKGISEDELLFKEILINEGPRLKRGRPVSRGMWHPIIKRMSHIRVVLTTRKSEIPNPKSKTEVKKGENKE